MPRQPRFSLRPVAGLVAAAAVSLPCVLVPGAAHAAGDGEAAPGPAAQPQERTSLGTITVSGERLQDAYAGGQVGRAARVGLLGDLALRDVPFSVTGYTAEFLENQQARTLADAVQSDAAVRLTSPAGGITDEFSIRGFPVGSPDIAFNGVYGATPYLRTPIEAVERVEVLKGPNALLNGVAPSGAVGGSINLVPKRAGDAPLTRITETYTSDSQFKTHLDVGRRFGEAREFGIRFNGAYSDGDTVVDRQSHTLALGALGLDYRGERLRASLDVARQADSTQGPGRWVLFSGRDIPAPPSARTNLLPDGYADLRDTFALAQVEYDVSDNVTVFAGLGTNDSRFDQLVGDPDGTDGGGNYNAAYYYRKGARSNVAGNVGLQARLRAGGVDHTVSASVNSLEWKHWLSSSFGASAPSNLYAVTPPPLPATGVASALPRGRATLTGAAIADSISLDGGRYIVILGLRHQQIKSTAFSPATGMLASRYDQSAVTPAVGLVFKPRAGVSVYANYIEGLGLGDIAPTAAGNHDAQFPPARSKQIEAGVKWELGGWTATAGVFQITRPASGTDLATNVFSVDGEQRNRGLEFNAFGEPVRGLRVLGGASFTDGVLTRTAGGLNDGKTAPGVPKVQVNAGAEWDVPGAEGFTLSGRVIHTSRQYIDSAETQAIPRWTRVDAGLRYRTQVNGYPVVLRGNVENLFDRNYWAGQWTGGYVYQGAPRTVSLSVSVDL